MRTRNLAAALLLFLLAPLAQQAAPLLLRPGDKLAVCGDSITEQKRYSVFIEDYLLACQPAAGLSAVQFGWGGDTTWGFLSRLHQNVAPFRPTVATTCFGMNDGGYLPVAKAGDRLDRYRQSLDGIVANFKAAGVRDIVVGSPGAVDTATFRRLSPDAYNETLAALGGIAREVAEKHGVRFADVHGAMLAAMKKAKAKHGPDHPVAGGDGVHPGANGHLVMAYAFLKALGCDGDLGAITWDCAAGRATAAGGHRVLAATRAAVELESTRYPFCFFDGGGDAASARRMVEFVPFNDDLNRCTLVVKNAPAPRVKITWGKVSREFAAADLERGINLAAEFLDNPFCDAFARVHETVMAQQAYETDAVKTLLTSLPVWTKHFPGEAKSTDARRELILKKSDALIAASRASVTPVRHTLAIEAL
jgi:lysophospholipase L1-like esterase